MDFFAVNSYVRGVNIAPLVPDASEIPSGEMTGDPITCSDW